MGLGATPLRLRRADPGVDRGSGEFRASGASATFVSGPSAQPQTATGGQRPRQ